MNTEIGAKLMESWAAEEGVTSSTAEILDWVAAKNREVFVRIEPCTLSECAPWAMDEHGAIRNENGGFFSICALKTEEEGKSDQTQPIIVQDEIGYLGMIVREIEGVYHFLIQAKIEPGNLNKIQLSPTIQATKSNFTQMHKGKKPLYLDYFLNAGRHTILSDQIQSEQSSRFYKKRNRNMLILVDEDVPVSNAHRWVTLGQIKTLLHHDNLVNMDTRTVLSALPFTRFLSDEADKKRLERCFRTPTVMRSILGDVETQGLHHAWHLLNNAKMFDSKKRSLMGLDQLEGWNITDRSISPAAGKEEDFEVIFCRIEIEGREVRTWTQPLFKARGQALFGLLMADIGGKRKFLCRLTPEVGCFDLAELGPTVQLEASRLKKPAENPVDAFFRIRAQQRADLLCDVLLSEEGGRFYHEQNRNVLLLTDELDIEPLPEGYLWLDFAQLSRLMESFNALNIQLRNLLSLLGR